MESKLLSFLWLYARSKYRIMLSRCIPVSVVIWGDDEWCQGHVLKWAGCQEMVVLASKKVDGKLWLCQESDGRVRVHDYRIIFSIDTLTEGLKIVRNIEQ